MKKLIIWKTSAVGLSTGVSVRCNECGVFLSNIPRFESGAETVFCPRCQKTTMATQFVFLTGEANPLPIADGDRRFMVTPNVKGQATEPLLAKVACTGGLGLGGSGKD